MTDQQHAFVAAYLKNNFNATKAAEVAGYSDPNAQGWHVKNAPEVAAAIQEELDKRAMSAGEVLAGLASHARGSLEDFLDFQPGLRHPVLSLEKARDAGKLHLAKSLKPNKYGLAVEMYDAQSALVQLGRHHKLFTDVHEHDFTKLSDEDLIAQAKGALDGDGSAGPDAGQAEPDSGG